MPRNGPAGAATQRAVQQKTITVTRELIPAAENSPPQETDDRDIFEVIDSLAPEDWSHHSIYLYRVEPKTTRGYGEANLGVYSAPFSLAWLRDTFGGETFRIILKRGSQRICDKRVTVELPPKYQTTERSATGAPLPAAAVPQNEAGAVAMMGTRMVDAAAGMVGNQPAVMQAMMGVFQDACAKATAMVISQIPPAKDPLETLRTAKEILAPSAAATDSTSPLLTAMMGKLVEKFMAPQDPIANFTSLLDAVKRTGLLSGGGRQADTWLEITRTVPVVGAQVVEGIREWRLAVEANRDAVTSNKGPAPATITTPPPTTANVLPAPPAEHSGPSLEWIESRIREIISDQNLTDSEAAEEALIYLERESKVLVSQLTLLGEQGILQLFRQRPILAAIPQNQRLLGFVRAFLELCKEPVVAPGPPEGTPPA